MSYEDLNRIEQINLANGLKVELDLDCKAPYYLQLNGDRLVWIERSNERNACFYEWSSQSAFDNRKSSLGCVQKTVQSFQLINDSVYFVTQDGKLYKFDKQTATNVISSTEANSSNKFSDATNANSRSTIEPKLIYNAISIKEKRFPIHLFTFQLILTKENTMNLYLSDLKHQALLLADSIKIDEFNGISKLKVVLSDQPSFFDFKFVNAGATCSQLNKEATNIQLKKENDKDVASSKDMINDKEIESNFEKVDMILTSKPQATTKDDTILADFQKEIKQELRKEMNDLADWNVDKIAFKQQNTNEVNLTNEYCTILSCNLIINLVVSIGLILILIVSTLAIFLGTSKRYSTYNTPLIESDTEDQSKCFFKRKINNIQFNIKKTIQTI